MPRGLIVQRMIGADCPDIVGTDLVASASRRTRWHTGQMKLLRHRGQGGLHYNGDRHVLEAGDSAYLDGGTPHGWENVGSRTAKALWVILG